MFESLDPKKYPGSKKPKNTTKYFETVKPISQEQIVKLLKKIY